MLLKMTHFFNKLMERFLPDAFLFAIILTFVVFGLGVLFTPSSPYQMILYWGDGLWNLVKFAMEMVLILVTGFTLAKTQFVAHILDKIAGLANTQTKAVVLSTIVSSIACYINWGFGLVVAGLFSLELVKRIKNLNFGLLVAASYSGFILWHGGISGSIPLKLTAPSAGIKKLLLTGDSISLQETIFSSFNLIILLANFLTILVVNYFLSKQKIETHLIEVNHQAKDYQHQAPKSFAQKIEQSKIIIGILALMSIAYIVSYLQSGRAVNLGFISFIFLFLGLCLHKTPKRFLHYFNQSVTQSSGIILQFPIYAGIMAMMKSSGLAHLLSEFFINISTDSTFLLFTYWSAGLVNFFVPSGGGQWALQAPFILPAANELGIPVTKAAMAIAWGDAWTNMVQPFWALPLLSIAGIKLKDMMGYSVIIFLACGLVSSLLFVII